VSDSAKFLIVTWDGGGNVPPALNLGARLVHLGHRVRVLGWPSMAGRAAAAGVELATYPSVPPWPAGLAFEDAMADRLAPALVGAGARDDIVAEAHAFGPDVVVVDCMMDAGFEAAIELELPTAVFVHLPYHAWTSEWVEGAAREERARIFGGMDAVLALVPPGFDPPGPLPANTAYVGPISNPTPPSRSIRTTSTCWRARASHGCCSASVPPSRGRRQRCRGCSTPLRTCPCGCC
jgi:hypothetical protein